MIEKYVCPRDTMTNEILWNLTSWWIFRRTKNIAKLIKKIFSLLFLKKKYNLLYYITHFLSFYYYCTCDPFLFFVLLICRYLLILSLIYHWNCFEWIKINWIECNFLHLMNFFSIFLSFIFHSFIFFDFIVDFFCCFNLSNECSSFPHWRSHIIFISWRRTIIIVMIINHKTCYYVTLSPWRIKKIKKL